MTVTKKPNLVPPVSATSTSTTAAKPASRRRTTTTKPVVASAPVAKQTAASPVATQPAKPAVRRAPATKPVVKPAEVSKPVVKTAPATAKPVVAPVVVPAVVKPAPSVFEPKAKKKPVGKKSKVVRDTFTIPAEEYLQIAVLKQRAQEEGRKIKKSELLRAGLAVLSALTTPQLLRALEQLAPVKTGRPPKK
jgi:hypothetical protein